MDFFLQSVGFGLVTASVIAIGSVGLTLQFGITNFINFAYGEFLTFGAYVGYLCTVVFHLNLLLGIVISMLATGCLAVALNEGVFQPFLRSKPKLLIMLIVTVAVSLILENGYQLFFGAGFYRYNISSGKSLHFGPFLWTPTQIAIIAIAVVVLGAVHGFIHYTRVGKAMRAMSDSQDLSQASGINTVGITRLVWMISGMLAGIAGVVLALNVYTVTPSLGQLFVFVLFAAVIMGGIGKPWGAMVSSVILGIAIEVSGAYMNAAYKTAVAFAILVIVLLVRPNGIFKTRGKH